METKYTLAEFETTLENAIYDALKTEITDSTKKIDLESRYDELISETVESVTIGYYECCMIFATNRSQIDRDLEGMQFNYATDAVEYLVKDYATKHLQTAKSRVMRWLK